MEVIAVIKLITGITLSVTFMLGISSATIMGENIEEAAMKTVYQQCVWDKCNAKCNKGEDTVCMTTCEQGKTVKPVCLKKAKDEANP